jgi:hypothetical protein
LVASENVVGPCFEGLTNGLRGVGGIVFAKEVREEYTLFDTEDSHSGGHGCGGFTGLYGDEHEVAGGVSGPVVFSAWKRLE